MRRSLISECSDILSPKSMDKPPMDMGRLFNSFEQCNEYISDGNDMDLNKYLDIIKSIPYDYELNRHTAPVGFSHRLTPIIDYTISIAHTDSRAFNIPISTLVPLGFNSDEYISKTPKWIRALSGYRDTNMDRELRFLKHFKLIENIDYTMTMVHDGGESFETGYSITRVALYRLIRKQYGSRFLETITGRIIRILFFFNEFKKQQRSKHIESLRKTIIGLNEDVKNLNEKMLFNKQNNRDPDIFTFEDGVFGSLNSSQSLLSNISSNEIMNLKDYTDELSTIHKTITSFIDTIDDRFSVVHHSMLTVVSKIDDLVGSIMSVKQNPLHLEQSFSPDRDSLTETCHSNPVLDHVQYIFNEYGKIGLTPPVSPTIMSQPRGERHTYIGSGCNL